MSNIPNKLKTIKQCANELGIPYRQLLQSVNDGTVPHYQMHKSHRRLDPQEVLAAMRTQSQHNLNKGENYNGKM